jgi:uncharacterized protein (TIGR03435 family)
MRGKLLLWVFAVTAATAAAQDSVPPKAGDHAPEINWTGVVQLARSVKIPPNLNGQYTVLRFLPNITANAREIGRWNDLISKFEDQPVQFVWIASENKAAVETFLREHPIKGWLLIDEKNEVARDYGCQMGGEVIVAPSGKIAGFTAFIDAAQLSAVLGGKAVAIPRDTDDDKVFQLLSDGKVRLDSASPFQWTASGPEKPNIAPSYEVHISPSKTKGTVGSAGPDFWVERGFDLKTIVSMVFEKDLSRVVLPEALDNGDKFDFVVVLPKEESQEAIYKLVQRAIEGQFRALATIVSKPADVYVMTALAGKTPPAKTGPESFGGGFTGISGFEFALPAGTEPTPEALKKAMQEAMRHPENIGIANISASNTTMDDFRRDLERSLDRPVIDETGLDGVYDIAVSGNAKNTDEFIHALREQTGIVLTPATRNIEFVILRTVN